jgi:hypothetical protein
MNTPLGHCKIAEILTIFFTLPYPYVLADKTVVFLAEYYVGFIELRVNLWEKSKK